jgi:hypothetical protein
MGHSLTSSHSSLFIRRLPLSLPLSLSLSSRTARPSRLTSHRSSYIAVTQTYRRTDSQIGRDTAVDTSHSSFFPPTTPHHTVSLSSFVQSVGTCLWVRLLVSVVVQDHKRTNAGEAVASCLPFLTPLDSAVFSVVECLSTRRIRLVSFSRSELLFYLYATCTQTVSVVRATTVSQ